MKKELDDQLCKKYPKIFRDRYSSPKNTAMCWGFDVGDGWFSLIDELCRNIQDQAKRENLDVRAVQVKEKFSGLRFYIYGGDEYVHNLIHFVENLSFRICEECGLMDQTVSQNKRGRIRTLCQECRKNEKNMER